MIQLRKARNRFGVNSVVQFLTYSDIMMLSGWGLVLPIIAVFITDNIEGGSVEVAGFAMTIYFLIKSFAQIPVARFIDRRKGEWDDYGVMLIGSLLISLCAFLYVFASEVWHIYAIQVVYGIGGALSYPAWLAIFTRHIDRGQEGFQWSFYYTTTDLGSALTAGLGGLIVVAYSYDVLFVIIGTVSLIGTAFLAGITRWLKKR